jgi:ABC-type uncharacterized transport system permease subunit
VMMKFFQVHQSVLNQATTSCYSEPISSSLQLNLKAWYQYYPNYAYICQVITSVTDFQLKFCTYF